MVTKAKSTKAKSTKAKATKAKATKAKATKAKSKKSETTKRRRKRDRPGSPVTIGGGAGLERREVYIQVEPGHWKWDAANGTLSPDIDGLAIDFVYINDIFLERSIQVREDGYGYYRPLQHLNLRNIKIQLD